VALPPREPAAVARLSEFPQSVVERLGFYVYALRDPHDGTVFYVGKGTGNRMFRHVAEALDRPKETDKLDRIRAIHAAGAEVGYEIVRHGLTEEQAFEVESALIDWIGIDDLTNAVDGHHADDRGRMTVGEIIATYGARPVTISEPAMLVILNRRFQRNIDGDRLYEATRGDWVVGSRKAKAKYVIAVFRGIVRAAYRVDAWEIVRTEGKGRKRWRFTGAPANELQHLIGGDVTAHLPGTSQNPIRYVNC
jgi:hypothetical protein